MPVALFLLHGRCPKRQMPIDDRHVKSRLTPYFRVFFGKRPLRLDDEGTLVFPKQGKTNKYLSEKKSVFTRAIFIKYPNGGRERVL